MNKELIDSIALYVEQNIGEFHANRIAKLQSVNLKELLSRKNPYMFKAKNIVINPAKRNVLDLKNETCKNREKRNVLKILHTRHFKTTKSSPKRAAFIVFER